MTKFNIGDKVKAKVKDELYWMGCDFVVKGIDSEGNPITLFSDHGYSYVNNEEYDFQPLGTKEVPSTVKPQGGPSAYYDFPFSSWSTANDLMEWLAINKWGAYSLHFKDIFKAGFRWGSKDGTTHEYDAKKIVYSGLRILVMLGGKEKAEEYLKELANDPQFSTKEN